MYLKLEESYYVGSNEVFLSVTVGQGQPGYVRVRLDGRLIADGNDSLKRVSLGDGDELHGSVIEVLTTVTDTNPQHNRTSVEHLLEGGAADERFLMAYEFDRPRQTAIYDARFELI